MSGKLAKTLAGIEAFEQLSAEEQDAIAAVSTDARVEVGDKWVNARAHLFDMWTPEPAALRRIERENPLCALVDEVHALRPDLVCAPRLRAESADLSIRRSDAFVVTVSGFSRSGRIVGPLRVQSRYDGQLGDVDEIAAGEFDAARFAAEVAEFMPASTIEPEPPPSRPDEDGGAEVQEIVE
jgi:hypothetical protein